MYCGDNFCTAEIIFVLRPVVGAGCRGPVARGRLSGAGRRGPVVGGRLSGPVVGSRLSGAGCRARLSALWDLRRN